MLLSNGVYLVSDLCSLLWDIYSFHFHLAALMCFSCDLKSGMVICKSSIHSCAKGILGIRLYINL